MVKFLYTYRNIIRGRYHRDIERYIFINKDTGEEKILGKKEFMWTLINKANEVSPSDTDNLIIQPALDLLVKKWFKLDY